MTAGERSRSDSGFSELPEKVVVGKEEREPGIMKRGRGGVREVSSCVEAEATGRCEPSPPAKGLPCPRNLDIRWGSRPRW